MRNNNGAFTDKDGRHVRYGLDNTSTKRNAHTKSSDLIGILPLTITAQMVGQRVGVFVAVEVKKPDWRPDKKLDAHEIAQKNFMDWIRGLGGFAGFANSLDSLRTILKF